MSRILIIIAGVIGGITLLWWFAAGSSFVALVDHLTTAPVDSERPKSFVFDEGDGITLEPATFVVGDRQRAVSAWRVIGQPADQLTLETTRGSFAFGPVTSRQSRRGERQRYEFQPDSGDVVSLTRRESRLSWPRPFEINWLGGAREAWARHVYFRLVWRKMNGDVLDVLWRDEKRFQKGNGWIDQYQPNEPITRLAHHSRATR